MMAERINTLPARHYLVRELKALHGAEAYAYLTMLLDLAQDIGPYELTLKIFTRECELKSQKASRLFEDIKRIFEESLKILGLSSNNPEVIFEESLKNPERIFEESSNNLSRSEGVNPRGSTHACASARALNINNINKNINIRSNEEFLTWYSAYPKKVAKGAAEKAYVAARKKTSAQELLDGLERYKANKPSYADWKNPASWLNGLCWEDVYDTPSPQISGQVSNKSEFEKLLRFPLIGDNSTGEIYKPEDLRLDETDKVTVWLSNGQSTLIGYLQGLSEVPQHAGA